jgi:atypical dual specificity phosphatase
MIYSLWFSSETRWEYYMSIEVLRLIKVKATLEPAFREQLMRSPLKFLQDYDLTEDEKRQIILPHFSWLVENKLAAMSYPEPEDAFTLLYRIGIRAMLNLSEAPLPYEALNKVGILTGHIPVVGFTGPTLHQVKQGLAMIYSCLDRSMPVAVHCVAGLGRTGTMLACYLVRQGTSADKAITTIREWRPGSIEVPEQEAVVYEYEHFIKTRV